MIKSPKESSLSHLRQSIVWLTASSLNLVLNSRCFILCFCFNDSDIELRDDIKVFVLYSPFSFTLHVLKDG